MVPALSLSAGDRGKPALGCCYTGLSSCWPATWGVTVWARTACVDHPTTAARHASCKGTDQQVSKEVRRERASHSVPSQRQRVAAGCQHAAQGACHDLEIVSREHAPQALQAWGAGRGGAGQMSKAREAGQSGRQAAWRAEQARAGQERG